MVGRPLVLARFDVDGACCAGFREFFRQQDVVYPQSHLPAEGVHAVVPPGKRSFRLLEQPERVFQPESGQGAKRFAFQLAEEHLAFPGGGIMHVAVLGRDVVIAEHRQPRVLRQFLLEPVAERGEPLELVLVLVGLGTLAGGYAAGYYSYKWAEVLSADAYSLFEEKGVLDPQTGQRFWNEVLGMGGSRPALESFVAFRGREPKMDALMRHNGMSGEAGATAS